MSHSRIKTALAVACVSTVNALSTALTSAVGGADLSQVATAATITGASTPLTVGAVNLLFSLNPALERRIVYTSSPLTSAAFVFGMEVLGSQAAFTMAEALFDVGISRALFSTYNGLGVAVLCAGMLLYQDLVRRENIVTNERNFSYLLSLKNKFVGFFSSQNTSLSNSRPTPSESLTPTPR